MLAFWAVRNQNIMRLAFSPHSFLEVDTFVGGYMAFSGWFPFGGLRACKKGYGGIQSRSGRLKRYFRNQESFIREKWK